MNIIRRYCVPLLFGFAMIVPWCVCSTCKVTLSRGMHEVRSWALTGCLDIFTLSANVRISKWLLLGFLVGIFPGFLSPRFALGHTSRSLLGWLGLCSRRAIGHSLSHTKHHHHNYHDHNRKDGNVILHWREEGCIGNYAPRGPRDLPQYWFCTPRPERLP